MNAIPSSTFPFGQPVRPVDSGDPGNRDCIIVGGLPSALAIRWRVPGGKLVQGFVVDNEPSPFWDGHDQDARIRAWRQAVCWQEAWGEAAPTRQNGQVGSWLNQQVLAPLALSRDRVCATTLLNTYHANDAARHRIDEHYRPAMQRLGLPTCMVPDHPGSEDLLRRSLAEERDRLAALLRAPGVRTLVTLGTASFRAMREVLGAAAVVPDNALGDGPAYGLGHELQFDGRALRWHAFVSPTAPASMQRVHTAWAQRLGAPLQRVGAFK
ncbi:MAG: hypothetical protein J0M02_15965 [Planctomycetes bacterium]|nr:hypothetical protein [Planctomycetota bacterium]